MLKTWLALLTLLLLGFASLFVGVTNVSFSSLFGGDAKSTFVVLTGRLPRLIAVIIAGAGLSICGLIMQKIANNKFVSPTTAGTISSAKLGILISLMFFPSEGLFIKSFFAIVVAIIGSFTFMKILRSLKFTDIILVPLVGIIFGEVVDSTTEFFAYRYNLLQVIDSWVQGDFSLVIKDRYELLYFALPALIVAYLYANKFSIVGMGEDNATNLGVNYQQTLYLGLVLISIVTALIVVIAGNIPFVGLIIPNLVSLWFGDNLKNTLVFTAIFGAIFTLICDIIARLIVWPFELSVGAVIGSIGSVCFLYLIYRKYRYGN